VVNVVISKLYLVRRFIAETLLLHGSMRRAQGKSLYIYLNWILFYERKVLKQLALGKQLKV
jgi:hypothetical protein